jgi:hypothetical protein
MIALRLVKACPLSDALDSSCAHFQINAVGTIAIIRAIDLSDIVGHALAAGVIVFGLDRARNGGRSSAEGAFT